MMVPRIPRLHFPSYGLLTSPSSELLERLDNPIPHYWSFPVIDLREKPTSFEVHLMPRVSKKGNA
jgi:hypothetical protein